MTEPFPRTEADYRQMAGLLSHELRLVSVATALTSSPNEGYGASQLRTAIINKQSEEQPPAWELDTYVPIRHCLSVGEPIFDVGGGTKFDKIKPQPDTKTMALAYCALGMGWSIRHPEKSLQIVLGRHYPSRPNSAPYTRLRMFQAILNEPDQTVGQFKLTEPTGLHERITNAHVHDLLGHGIIEREKYQLRLHPTYARAIQSLCLGFTNTPTHAEAFSKQAIEMINDSRMVWTLIQKAKIFSPSYATKTAHPHTTHTNSDNA